MRHSAEALCHDGRNRVRETDGCPTAV